MKTTIHYTATGKHTHTNGQGKIVTTDTHFNGIVRHVGLVDRESAAAIATKHAARRGLVLKAVQAVLCA